MKYCHTIILFLLFVNLSFGQVPLLSKDRFALDSIIPVYRLSETEVGLAITIWESEDNESFEKLLESVTNAEDIWTKFLSGKSHDENYSVVDTAARIKLISIRSISDSLSFLIGKKFYIYGEKGIYQSNVSDILIRLDQCETNFIFLKLNHIDPSIGHPIMAMQKKIPLKFERDTVWDKRYNESLMTLESDYVDSIETVSFARWGKFHLVYSDSFDWYIDPKKCYFPSRGIINENNGEYNWVWGADLDLFGIPCD
jgi:hypothetical protein